MYAFWGQDIDKKTTPFDLNREFRVSFDKEFIGKAALLKQKQEGIQKKDLYNFFLKIMISILIHGHGVVNLFIVMVNFVVLLLQQPMVLPLENKYVWVMFMHLKIKKSQQIISVVQHMKLILQQNVSKHALICINHLRWVLQFNLVHLRSK